MEKGRLFAVVATPVEAPAVVERDRWPVHVTIAGNFRIEDAHADAISALLATVAKQAVAFDASLGPVALFGVAQDIPVLLAEHPAFSLLHQSLAIGLKRLRGFTAVEPSYWGSGFRPHATLGPAVSVRDGDTVPIRFLTLVSLGGNTGRRVSSIELQPVQLRRRVR